MQNECERRMPAALELPAWSALALSMNRLSMNHLSTHRPSTQSGRTPLPRRWQRALRWSKTHPESRGPDLQQIKLMLAAERSGRQG